MEATSANGKGKEPMVETATEANPVAEPVTALYVGDLDGSVTEEQLKLFFSQIGDVISVKICTDLITERSLGYGYVNFSNPKHAEKALKFFNFAPLNGKPIRVAYSNRVGGLRKSGLGNIFVKNLDKSIDHKALYNIFSAFGNIISCKVETDSSGLSRGYGYVQFDNVEAGRSAIDGLNGEQLHEKILRVESFISKQEREMSVDKTKFTNVFIKNFSEATTEQDLVSIFGGFGSISSVAVLRDEAGNSKCFGFVNFENTEDAARSVEVLNGRISDGKKWYVGRAQKKSERQQELKIRHQELVKEATERSFGTNNLYIKNFDEKIDDGKLKELFTPFGTITSSKIMCDQKGISKGYGFVAFSTTQEASRAISEMNGKIIGSKPLYIGIAERKEVRNQRLQSMFSNTSPTAMVPPPLYPRMPIYGIPGIGQQIFYGHVPPAVLPTMPGFGYQQQLAPGVRPPGPLIPNALFSNVPWGFQSPRIVSGGRARADLLQRQEIPFRGNAHRPPPQDTRMHRSAPVGTLASALANASPSEQMKMLGSNLYPLVERLEPGMAAKLTGMLLEMDQTEVLHLLESPESLRAKVVDAMDVIRNESQQRDSSPSEQLASLSLND